MARLPRIVLPNVPHHVTQRGNRRLPIFFSDDDRLEYLSLIASASKAAQTRCLAWCLMDNHVHLILTPASQDGLRATLGELFAEWAEGVGAQEEGSEYYDEAVSELPNEDPAKGGNGSSSASSGSSRKVPGTV